ncbi:MAG: phenylalanine--tRNA ligase subunit beta, partial [Candidatus Diapherotrites archaeon]|nr:phenylalanine--tRNA ligase subunit beta [Candidatus Diapherotrites archaeon]
LEEALLFVKGEIDKIEGDKITLDVKETNRPDLWGVEGIAQELRGRLGIEKGIPKFKTTPSGISAFVDPQTKTIRPAVAVAVVEDAKISQNFLNSIISLQEKIALTFGRKRKEAAIGIFELSKLTPPLYYKAFEPREIKFVPLGFSEEMNLEQILAGHPKGKEFGHLLADCKKYPIWVDSKGTVASFPPIINSETTGKVDEGTKSVIIEASGFLQETVNTAVIVMAQAFAMRGAKIKTVQIKYQTKKIVTPVVGTQKISLELDHLNKICGIDFSPKQAVELLQRARYDAKAKGKKIEAVYPSYRHDILHQVDAIEDALISFSFSKILPKKTELPTVGQELAGTLYLDKVRDACIGLGLQEILTFTLTSKEKQQNKFGLKEEEFAELANPLSSNYEIFRKTLLPESLEFLSKNKHCEFPQKIFEIGKTVELNPARETRVDEKNKLCICASESKANYSLIKSHLDAVCSYLGLEYSLSELKHPAFEEGKSAAIEISGKKGFMGEISQKVLQNFGLETKTAALEIEV